MLLRRSMALALALAAAAMWAPPRLGHATGGHSKRRLVGVAVGPGCHSSSSTSRSTTPGSMADRTEATGAPMAAAAGDLRSEFREVLLSRRRERQVPLTVEQGSPVKEPLYQGNGPLGLREAMESCPRKEVDNFEEKLVEENFYLMTESGEQGRLPVLLLKLNDTAPERKPVVVILHSSYKCKEWLRPLLEAYASRGYIAVAIDSRYHGERASSKTTYIDALKSSWKNGDTMPFIFDTVWDLIKLGDHLSTREDVDPSRIGITGESLGGMHAWFAAFVDTRYSVVVPIIGVQGFQWAIDNDMWQARVDSIKPLFEEARIDSGKSEIDAEAVRKVWDQIAPGMASQFDAPYSVPLIAPRPLLLLNGADDPRCPVLGLQEPASKAAEAYKEAGSADKFKFMAEPGVGHRMTASMVKEASDWFDRFL
uniref:Peptidase S9 prolyl oligopeptidase catalytic domain-containing protein n=2 Tax=Hordeum vulgare subsp. vulgare TaxID=112509 RepID=A0A8I7BDD0_HORVV